MNHEEILQAAYNRGFEKGAMSSGLSDVALGAGPEQMTAALQLLGQAKALGTPTDRELSLQSLTRPNFVKTLGRMSGKPRLSDARTDKKVNMILGALAGAGIGTAGGAGSGAGVLGTLGLAGLGAGGGALAGKLRADTVNGRVLRTMKVLKDRGVLTPELLRKARPILT